MPGISVEMMESQAQLRLSTEAPAHDFFRVVVSGYLNFLHIGPDSQRKHYNNEEEYLRLLK